MENDEKNTNIIDINQDINKKIFKTDFVGQNINKNREFIVWKNKMNIIYGKTDKLFYCSEEGLYFYSSKSISECQPTYTVRCPNCLKFFCYFCSKYIKDNENENDNYVYCCFKRLICYKSFRIDENIEDQNYFGVSVILFLIPYISLILIIASFSVSLFYKNTTKNSSYHNYGDHIKNKGNIVFIFFLGINILIAVILAIPYILISVAYILIILIISVPLEFIPAKFIVQYLDKNFID